MKKTTNMISAILIGGFFLINPDFTSSIQMATGGNYALPAMDNVNTPQPEALKDVPVQVEAVEPAEEPTAGEPTLVDEKVIFAAGEPVTIDFYTVGEDVSFTEEEKQMVVYKMMEKNGLIYTSENLQ